MLDLPEDRREFIMSGVERGFRITNFCISENEPVEVPNYSSVQQYQSMMESQIAKEVKLGRYRICPSGYKPRIVSALGALPKSSGGVRIIHDCSRPVGKSVNSAYESDGKLRFTCVKNFVRKLHRGDFMCKVDLSEAYRSCGVHPDDHGATGIKFKFCGNKCDTYMYDTRLPFGAAASVTVFHHLSEAVKLMMIRRGFQNTEAYLDDFAFCGPRDRCQSFFVTITGLLTRLGFSVNWSKCQQPSQVMTFLGVELNSTEGVKRLPSEKVQKLLVQLEEAASASRVSKRALQQLIGKLGWASQVLQQGRPFLRDLINQCNSMSLGQWRSVDGELSSQLQWWRTALLAQQWAKLWFDGDSEAAIESDACQVGGAAVLHLKGGDCDWRYLNWSLDAGLVFQALSINYKEAAMPLLALLSWRDRFWNCRLSIYIDNQAACHIINNGVSKCPQLMRLLQTVALLCVRQNILLRAYHVPGEFQIYADPASRLHDPRQFLNFLFRFYGCIPLLNSRSFVPHALSAPTFAFLLSQAAKLRQTASPAVPASSWVLPTHIARRAPSAATCGPG